MVVKIQQTNYESFVKSPLERLALNSGHVSWTTRSASETTLGHFNHINARFIIGPKIQNLPPPVIKCPIMCTSNFLFSVKFRVIENH